MLTTKAYLYHIRAHYSILRDVKSEAYAPPREPAAIQMGLYGGGKILKTQRVTFIQPNLDAVDKRSSEFPVCSSSRIASSTPLTKPAQ